MEAIFDAEHFFDGYKDNPEYALAVLCESPRSRSRLDRLVRYERRHSAHPKFTKSYHAFALNSMHRSVSIRITTASLLSLIR